MTARPHIAPELAAAILAAIPDRLRKKLDAAPTLAEAWTWSSDTVTTDKGELVRFTLAGDVVTAITCSCLLQARCLHIAAVVAVLDPAEDDMSGPGRSSDSSPDASPDTMSGLRSSDSSPGMMSGGERANVARMVFRVVADVLVAGGEASGAFAQGELLRSIHACRTAGLYRLAAAQTRMLRSIRELRADRAEFALDVLTGDLRDALAVAHALAGGAPATTALLGTARRGYETIGNLRLRGLFTEAVVARSGYAGAITYLMAETGVLYTRADVAPGDASRAAAAYEASAGIGEAVLPHRELARGGLFVSAATASADGRLGAGQQVRAVRASEPSRWDREPIDARFRVPFEVQLAELAARDAVPDELRPAGWNLVFVEGVIASAGSAAVGLALPGAGGEPTVMRLTAPLHRGLVGRDNLIALSRAPGLAVRAIGRVRLGVPRELALLALGPAAGETLLAFPEAWEGRANVHYDRLTVLAASAAATTAAPISAAASTALAAPAPPAEDLLAPLRRRVERAVLGGAGTLPTHAIAELEREAALLADRALRGGADVLRELAALAHDAGRAATGARKTIDRAAFARAWLRAALYEDAARRRLAIASW